MPPAASTPSSRRRGRTPPATLRTRVRWDRVARTTLLLVLLGVLALYVQPARNYLSTWNEASRARAGVQRLEREHSRLLSQERSLRDSRTVETAARRLGLVRPTERSFVVRGLPRG
ncbi:MAG: hypothetical protein QOK31_1028 [Solirubrobacteraceae bacterium]|jgi:cell division protein FtsL|nr:hypothetical protein [Solirubrobacteraceae bacterium]